MPIVTLPDPEEVDFAGMKVDVVAVATLVVRPAVIDELVRAAVELALVSSPELKDKV